MITALLLLAIALPHATPQQSSPRDPSMRPAVVASSAAREAQLAQQIAAQPANVATYVELAKLQEDRGAYADAEATLLKARSIAPKQPAVHIALSAFYNRQGDFEKTIAVLEDAAQLTPDDPQGHQIIATYYWEKAYKDHRLLPAEQYTYIMKGIAAADRGLAVKPDYVEALTYKNLLLRMRANLESDAVLRQQLIAEADELRNKAIELNKARAAVDSGNRAVMLGPVPPPPPPPPAGDYPSPIRVGGNIKTPVKTKDVRPVYPPEAQAAGVQGVVIIEATIDPAGRVSNAKVLRSIPALDQAALDAVNQWEFMPTLLNGAPVPVIMTVTVNFTVQ